MASPTSSPVSLILLRPLPCGSLFLSKHRRQFPSPRIGCLAAKEGEQRLLLPPLTSRRRRGGGFACFSYNSQKKFPPPSNKSLDQWPILRRWDVPWGWQTVVLTMVGCGVRKHSECSLDSFVLTGLVEQSALQYVGYKAMEATIDEKAEILFLGQLYNTASYSYVNKTFQFHCR
ncbi:hypothetical protein PR202_ga15859 [Eleusine coracana subsp. coracana]|uniref:Uncharacterized protein n=1 Tax=Eleusine coracana subsp. coracana TaxID=191504 RepID=A0AAV5CL11_ELECO|nr:hypothetical protein PR202_ga15859 [Eleusine coracana subsp. coracana]